MTVKISKVIAVLAAWLGAASAGADAPPSRYLIDGNTVTDTKTDLVWTRAAGTQQRTHGTAVNYCEALSTAGGGWRLPTYKELLTLVDPTRYDPAIDTNAFPATPSLGHWSASTYEAVSSWNLPEVLVHLVDFKTGGSATASTAGPADGAVRCVR